MKERQIWEAGPGGGGEKAFAKVAVSLLSYCSHPGGPAGTFEAEA